MTKKKKKRKINYHKIIELVIFITIVILTFFGIKNIVNNDDSGQTVYAAGTNYQVSLYDKSFEEVLKITRGEKLSKFGKEVIDTEKDKTYYQVNYNQKEYLISKDNVTLNRDDIVLEEELYVRTPATIYVNETDSSILGLANKGDKVEVIGYDKVEDGVVNKYKVKLNDEEGYIYGKYLVLTEEEALANYDEDGTYQTHLKRTNTLGGGSAANLDYYPREKVSFEDNVMPDEVRALYLNVSAISNVDDYIDFALKNNINALVVDIKDNTRPGYPSEVMKEMSPTNYSHAANSYDAYKEAIQKIKDAGLYVIGRITTFKDSYYVEDHPESAISDAKTGEPYSHNSSYWPSAYSRDVWEFNVELAKEAVTEMGFNEIQFDYVRFPDHLGRLEEDGIIDLKNTYDEEKAQSIQRFLMYATDELHNLGVYVSADVFGESAHSYVTAYGQYWPAISNVVDVISAMPYPDHFGAHDYNIEEIVWTVPYTLLSTWGKYAAARQTEIPTPAIVRTWIQAYNTIKAPYIEYDAEKISEEIQGLYNAGLTGGYMTWNSGSSLSKYNEIADAFKKEY
ncbi:MAG: putative glycoside hydrolase [Bacilli bacterium]|nr:putative glycoside hydrolase [Bacilli bacterium]